tara:strand:- start:185 stop:703 length:519 start_codon:yes stop_codon:yes gene_type:complete
MFKLRSGNKPEFRKLSGVASPNKKVDATAVTDKLKEKVASVANVKDKVSSVKDKLSSVKSKAAGIKDKMKSVRDSKVGEKIKSKITTKAGLKVATAGLKNVSKKAALRGGLKVAAKIGARAIPGVGQAMMARDVYKLGKHAWKNRAKIKSWAGNKASSLRDKWTNRGGDAQI